MIANRPQDAILPHNRVVLATGTDKFASSGPNRGLAEAIRDIQQRMIRRILEVESAILPLLRRDPLPFILPSRRAPGTN